MSSNQNPSKLNFFQKRKMVTDLDDLVSQQEQIIVENEADPAIRKTALSDIKLSRDTLETTRKAIQPIPYFFQRPGAVTSTEIKDLEAAVETRHANYKKNSSEAAKGRTSNRIDANQRGHIEAVGRSYEQMLAQPLPQAAVDSEVGEPISLPPPPRKTPKVDVVSIPDDAQAAPAVARQSSSNSNTPSATAVFKRGHKYSGTFGENIITAEEKNNHSE